MAGLTKSGNKISAILIIAFFITSAQISFFDTHEQTDELETKSVKGIILQSNITEFTGGGYSAKEGFSITALALNERSLNSENFYAAINFGVNSYDNGDNGGF